MRWEIGLLVAVTVSLGCGDNTRAQTDPPLGPVTDPLEWVDPTIGSGGLGFAYGSAFVGAAAPHGMVKLGPDTSGEFGTVAFQHFSGYYAGDDVIERFSHMHLHGAGLSDYGLIGVMPTIAFDSDKTTASSYRARFSKGSEESEAGSYRVTLEPAGIVAELTATTRGGHHRYSFPAGSDGTIVVDLLSHLNEGDVSDATLELGADGQSFTGSLHSDGQMSGNYGGHELYFLARFAQPWARVQSWDGGAAFEFDAGAPVEMQIALSFVSAEGAAANFEAELPAFDFEMTREKTRAAWRELLEAVLVEGGTPESRRVFYSALYRSFLMPTITSDVDGSYVYGGETGRMAVGSFMCDLSLWDTYRTLHPLYHLIAPESGADAARSLVAMSAAGSGFPRWPIATGEAGTMLGASADVVLADAAIKLSAIEGFDAATVFSTLAEIATEPGLSPSERGGRHPADDYIALGYVPSELGRSVSTQLEYAVDDFALAQMAHMLGRTDDAESFTERSLGYRRLFDSRTKTFRPLSSDGEFEDVDGYDPLAFGSEFAEANAMQMLWAPLYDTDGLSELLGGDKQFVATLTTLFEEARLDLEANPLDEIIANASPRPHYWHGNEPDIHAAYLFAQVGRDDLTQTWLSWIRESLYSDKPDGLAGNDDSGTLSSWFVWSALGIYPVAGSERYFVGMPVFPRITVRTSGGTLVITAPNIQKSLGIAGARSNGESLERAELTHGSLLGEATIEFEPVAAPTAWSQR